MRSLKPAEPLGFRARVLQQVFYYAKGSGEPSCTELGGGGFGSPGPSFEDWHFSSQLRQINVHSVIGVSSACHVSPAWIPAHLDVPNWYKKEKNNTS